MTNIEKMVKKSIEHLKHYKYDNVACYICGEEVGTRYEVEFDGQLVRLENPICDKCFNDLIDELRCKLL